MSSRFLPSHLRRPHGENGAACTPARAKVARACQPGADSTQATEERLNDEIAIEIGGWDGLRACVSANTHLVLHLDGRPISCTTSSAMPAA
jgi:hypothetical protein